MMPLAAICKTCSFQREFIHDYFRLDKSEANSQLERIRAAVAKWRDVAKRLGISRREQEDMSVCFARV